MTTDAVMDEDAQRELAAQMLPSSKTPRLCGRRSMRPPPMC